MKNNNKEKEIDQFDHIFSIITFIFLLGVSILAKNIYFFCSYFLFMGIKGLIRKRIYFKAWLIGISATIYSVAYIIVFIIFSLTMYITKKGTW